MLGIQLNLSSTKISATVWPARADPAGLEPPPPATLLNWTVKKASSPAVIFPRNRAERITSKSVAWLHGRMHILVVEHLLLLAF
jgi:hypothetical protein